MHLFRSTCTILLLATAAPFVTVTAAPVAGAQRPEAAPVRPATPFSTERSPQAAPATLEQLRGGSGAVADATTNIASDTQLRGTTDNNNATNVVTGNNMIQSSFTSAAGIPVVIQNSGANVLIQNATVVNLQFK